MPLAGRALLDTLRKLHTRAAEVPRHHEGAPLAAAAGQVLRTAHPSRDEHRSIRSPGKRVPGPASSAYSALRLLRGFVEDHRPVVGTGSIGAVADATR
jgi:hypothetical protein